MSFVAFIEAINFVLAVSAALVSFGIYKKVVGSLALSWRDSFIAFQVLALAMLFTVLNELGISTVFEIDVLLLRNVAHFFFVIIAFLGLSRQYQILKDITKRSD